MTLLLSLITVFDTLLNLEIGLAGFALIVWTLLSAVRAIVLPRSEKVALNNVVFGWVRWFLYLIAKPARTYAARDRVVALIGPVGLLVLPVSWLALLSVGFTLMYYSLGIHDLYDAYDMSGSALLTLGPPMARTSLAVRMTVFAEATLGLLVVALVITYLPTIYTAFTKRETVVAQLEMRAGMPASAAGLVVWLHEMEYLSSDGRAAESAVWQQWEQWFMDIEESHTTLPVLAVFRSREPGRSWVTAAACILDAAALVTACVEVPRDPYRDLCLKAGVITVNRVARFFQNRSLPGRDDTPHRSIQFSRDKFGHAYDQMVAAGIDMKLPEAVAWVAFNDLRVRYQEPLRQLAKLAMTPTA